MDKILEKKPNLDIKYGSNTLVGRQIYQPEMLDKLLEAGAGSTEDLLDLIKYATILGREDSLQIIIKHSLKYGVNVNSVNSDGKVPLNYVLEADLNPEVTKTLLKAGAKPNIQDAKGNTALTNLVDNIKSDSSKKLPVMVKMLTPLLKHNAKINDTTDEGKSALKFLIEVVGKYLENENSGQIFQKTEFDKIAEIVLKHFSGSQPEEIEESLILKNGAPQLHETDDNINFQGESSNLKDSDSN